MAKKLSAFSDIHAFVIRPKNGGFLTLKDQKRLGGLSFWRKSRFCVIHFSTAYRKEIAEKLRSVKLSKPMLVTEITDAQWGRRFMDTETISGTGLHATKVQLEKSFEIGKEVA